jgi:tRNA pseudouridine38-40 synthase
VEEALEEALGRAGVRAALAVAARTDAGVHALGQVVSFTARLDLDPDALRADLNRAAPEGLLVLDAWRAPAGFHARGSARARRYVYLVGSPPPGPLLPYAWSLPDPRAFPGVAGEPDAERVRAALAHAVGTHDFAGLARPGEQRTTIRTVTRADVVSAPWAPLHALVFEGHGFLRAMIRNLVGTAVAAGLGVASPDDVRALILARARYRGVRAPGWGLTLVGVTYPAGRGPGERGGPAAGAGHPADG